jgi:hypothetical protein
MAKKSYNPFKMWGSYLGAALGVILHFFVSHGGDLETFLTFGSHVVDGTAYFFAGFLVGYGIHSLMRVMRK